MQIEVWSDIVCPWCYVGKRRLEAALDEFPHADEVTITWRAFELDPGAPRERTGDRVEHLARKYGISTDQARAAQDHLTSLAAADGLTFRFDRARPGNTLDAHRLLHLAADQGRQGALKERLLAAYLTDGAPIGDPGTLVDLAAEVGIDPDDARTALASGAYLDAVRADERAAAELGITGVPFFVFDRRYAVSGAQSPEVLRGALDRAWATRAGTLEVTVGGDATCDGDACPV